MPSFKVSSGGVQLCPGVPLVCPSALGPNSGAGLRGRAWSGGPSVMDPGLDIREKLRRASCCAGWAHQPESDGLSKRRRLKFRVCRSGAWQFFFFPDNLKSTKKCVFEAFPDSFCPNASACYGKMTPTHLRYVTCVREGQGYRPGK